MRAMRYLVMALVASCGGQMEQAGPESSSVAYDAVLHGRHLVLEHDCGACHGGGVNPAAAGYLAGNAGDSTRFGEAVTRPRNITPDLETGIGRYTDRQLFNALRFGLRPDKTPDVTITSTVPGNGNHPVNPMYLGPFMPWPSWRHMSDEELWAIVAYLKRGLKPVTNKIPDFQPPPDGWRSAYTEEKIGAYPAKPYPTAQEVAIGGMPDAMQRKILRGRWAVISHACGDCHGGANNPASPEFLVGMRNPEQEFKIGPFKTRPRNLTPDNVTGLGRFSERQIFNSLRFGLRPGDTPDVEITSATPGQGNFPLHPKYLAVPMPWPAWRHMSDEDLWAIAAYLKHGLKPVVNKVQDSEGPPDFWASEYTVEKIGSWPALPFPTANEVAKR